LSVTLFDRPAARCTFQPAFTVDDRFWQLHALALEGNEEAQADLWNEYEFTYGLDKAPVTNDRLIQAVFTATEEAKEQALPLLEGREKPAPADPALLLMGEAAELLNVSRPTLWRMLKAGRLQKVELYPGSFRLRRSDIMAIISGDSQC